MYKYVASYKDEKFMSSSVFAASVYLLRCVRGSECRYESDTIIVFSNGESQVKIEFADQSLKKFKLLEGSTFQFEFIKSLLITYMRDHYIKDKIEGEKKFMEYQLHNQITNK